MVGLVLGCQVWWAVVSVDTGRASLAWRQEIVMTINTGGAGRGAAYTDNAALTTHCGGGKRQLALHQSAEQRSGPAAVSPLPAASNWMSILTFQPLRQQVNHQMPGSR